MNKKLGPFILLGSLVFLLIFIFGVRYGKKVEKTNEAVNFMLSLPPTKAPTPTKPINFKTFKHEGCGVQFLYPEMLRVDKNASDQASLRDESSEAIVLTCNKVNSIHTQLLENKLATEEIKLKNQAIKARTDRNDPNKKLLFEVRNPINGKQIAVSINKNLFPLFENTLQYTK